MNDDHVESTIRRAIGGDQQAIADLMATASDSVDARTVALAAVLASRLDWLARARSLAASNRDRQIVAISASHLSGDHDLVQMLARDHLADHPDSLIVAWLASQPDRCP